MKSAVCVVPGDELLAALEPIVELIEARNMIPILAHVFCEWSDEEQSLKISATDLDCEYRCALNGNGTGGDLAFTLPAVEFNNFVRETLDAVDFSADLKFSWGDPGKDRPRIQIYSGGYSILLESLPVADWPAAAFFGDGDEVRLGTEFSEALEWVTPAVSTEETRYYLNGVFVHSPAPGELACVATDGHRLMRQEFACADAGDIPEMIIPRKALAVMRAIVGKPIRACIDREHLAITFEYLGGTRLFSKLIDGKFPDYKVVIPDPAGLLSTVTLEADALHDAVRVVRSATRPNIPEFARDDFDDWGDASWADQEEVARWTAFLGFDLGKISPAGLTFWARDAINGEVLARATIPADLSVNTWAGMVGLQASYVIDAVAGCEGPVRISPSAFDEETGKADAAVRFDYDDRPDRVSVLMPLREY